jgi:hypothetical protein
VTARLNTFEGMEISNADMTFFILTGVDAQVKSRITDYYTFGVVNGLSVYTDTTDFQHVAVGVGTAYDPTGERIPVPVTVKGIGYNNAPLNATAANYTLVARYLEGNDGITGQTLNGTTTFTHIVDSYSLLALKTGTDSLGINDVRLSGITVTLPGGSFVFDSSVRDTASSRFGGGSGGSGGSSGSGTSITRTDQIQTATANQMTFSLLYNYPLGVHALDVYVNGLKETAYTELDVSHIVFSSPLPLNTQVETVIVGVVPTGPVQNHAPTHLQGGTDPIVYPWTTLTVGNISLTTANYGVYVQKTIPSGTTVTLPANPPTSTTFLIKDGKGDCTINPIILSPASGTIDGATLFTMNQSNRMSLTVEYTGSEYSLV